MAELRLKPRTVLTPHQGSLPGRVYTAPNPASLPRSFPEIQTHASLVAQTVKNLPVMQETWIQSLDWEDPLEKGMATHSSILAWRIPLDREAWQATVHGLTKSQT